MTIINWDDSPSTDCYDPIVRYGFIYMLFILTIAVLAAIYYFFFKSDPSNSP